MRDSELQQAFDAAVDAVWRQVHGQGSSVAAAEELSDRYAELAGIGRDMAAERIMKAVASMAPPL